MKLRCTVLCLVMLAAAFAQRRSDAQGFYGPYQPGYPEAAPGGPGAGMLPPWQQMPGAAMPPYGPSGPYGPPGVMPASFYGDGMEAYPGPEVGPGEYISDGAYCDTCGDPGCCGSPQRFWFDAEYLVGWRQGRYLPPLVTTSPPGTLQEDAGVLPGAQILFGGQTVFDNPTSGFRLEAGMWLDHCHVWGLGASGYSFGDNTIDFGASSNGDTTLALPFFNTLTGMNDAQLIAFTDPVTGRRLVRGNVGIHATNSFAGGDVFLRKKVNGALFNDYVLFMMQGPAWIYSCFQAIGFPSLEAFGQTAYTVGQRAPIARLDLLGGYETARITDALDSRFSLVSLNRTFLDPVGTRIDVMDQFTAYNEFQGGMLGLMLTADRGCWSMEFTGKVGIGNMHQNVTNRGLTVVTLPPPFNLTDRRNRGFLTPPSVTGSFSQDQFTVVPEARIKLRRQLTCHFDVYMSYSLIYWNNVALGGDQANLAINPFEPDNTPNDFSIQSSSFFVQSLGFGARYQY